MLRSTPAAVVERLAFVDEGGFAVASKDTEGRAEERAVPRWGSSASWVSGRR